MVMTSVFCELGDHGMGDTLETSGVVGVGSDFAVDFDESLHENCSDFAFVQCILEAISSISNTRRNSRTVGRGSKEDIHVPCEAQERL